MDAAFFDDWAKDYDQDVVDCDRAGIYPFAGYRLLMETIFSELMKTPGARVLDLGIGTGFLSRKLYQAGFQLTGIDFSAEMCRIASKNMPGARLICHDFARGLPLELNSETFEFVISTYAFHHVPDEEKIERIREWHQLLTPGGAIVIGDVAFATMQDLQRCQLDNGEDWDADEFYTVFENIQPALVDLNPEFRKISFCAGIIRIKK